MVPLKYTNPKVPEGISSGHEHPLVEVAKSSAIVIALLAALIVGAFYAARLAAPYVPFSWEQALARRATGHFPENDPAHAAMQARVQKLADRLVAVMALPEGMTVTVHYVDSDTVNAFATLGGQVVVFSGLWQKLDSENAAAMLLGHEIAHIKNRDPLRSLSGALLASLAIGAVVGDVGILGNLSGAGGLLTALHFSRVQEAQADADGLAAVAALYGHVAGATELFETLRRASTGRARPPAILASHPDLAQRIAAIKRQAVRSGWPLDGAKAPLP